MRVVSIGFGPNNDDDVEYDENHLGDESVLDDEEEEVDLTTGGPLDRYILGYERDEE